MPHARKPLSEEQISRHRERIARHTRYVHDRVWALCSRLIGEERIDSDALFMGVAGVITHMLTNLHRQDAITPEIRELVRGIVNDQYAIAFDRPAQTSMGAVILCDQDHRGPVLPSDLKVV